MRIRFVLPPGGGDGVGSNKLSPWEALLMETTRNTKVPGESKLASSEHDRGWQTRIRIRESVAQNNLPNGLLAILAGIY